MTHEEAYTAGFCKAAEALGVSPRSLVRRMAVKEAAEKRAQETGDGTRAIGNNVLESLGKWTTPVGLAGIGAAAGKGKGALIGTGAGIGANALGSLVALVTKSRTGDQQAQYDTTLKLRNLLIPALAAFNKAKRKERAQIHGWH